MSTSTIEDKYPEIVCSLTNELMINPVITNKGISYEKEAIEEWLNNKKICPITNEYLDKTLLITNYTLKNLISKLNTDNNKNNEPKEVDNQAPDYLIKISNLDKPKLDPASLNPFPTCLIPKLVSRIIGGNAKIIVATTPGVKPIPNNITTGIK